MNPANRFLNTTDPMQKIKLSALAVLALSLTGCATEYRTVEQPWPGYGSVEQRRPEYRTIEQPRTEYRTVETPRQECWNEQVPAQSADSGYGGAIIGGIAGGILGNQVGGGSGKTAATAVGAIAGAMAGDRISSDSSGYRTVQRCRTVIDYEQIPVVIESGQVIRQPERSEEREYYNEREGHRPRD
jgi:uncharacterized protein YcfJ